jgi:hypothetical protein
MIEEVILSDPMILAVENYVDILSDQIELIYNIQFDHSLDEPFDEDICDMALEYYFTIMMPPRSYVKFRKSSNIAVKTSHINYLRDIPQPDQRTPEWYLCRYNMITASSAWKALDSEKIKNSYIYEKCEPLNVDKYSNVNVNTAMHWGILFEPLSILLYERMNNTVIEDFGCIPSADYSYMGASPDGINVKEGNALYGRMLEVKNVVSRTITGSPKKDYWIQMQMQMNICRLNECDFLETKFVEYDSFEEFNADGTFTYSTTDKLKGVIISFLSIGKPIYEYAPLYATESEYDSWTKRVMKKHKELTWVKNIYWKLEVYSCVLVLRNKIWYNSILPQLKHIWKTVEYERIHGYAHRAPRKNTKKSKPSCDKPFNGCILSTVNFKPNDQMMVIDPILTIDTEVL